MRVDRERAIVCRQRAIANLLQAIAELREPEPEFEKVQFHAAEAFACIGEARLLEGKGVGS